MDVEEIVKRVVAEIQKMNSESAGQPEIPVGVSNRHVHLSSEDLSILFGNKQLTVKKNLSQPGQFAAEECVTLVGPKGCIEKVRVLGPVRNKTQVEILSSDTYKLGTAGVVRESGKLSGTPGIIITGPCGCARINEGVIVAQRHIHMSPQDAEKFGCIDGQTVKVCCSGIRGGIYDNVLVRVSDKYKLDFHIDIDEANSFGVRDGDIVKIQKNL